MAPRQTSIASADMSLDAAALSAVDEAARAIAGLLDIEEALQLIVDRVRSLVGAGTRPWGSSARTARSSVSSRAG